MTLSAVSAMLNSCFSGLSWELQKELDFTALLSHLHVGGICRPLHSVSPTLQMLSVSLVPAG